MSKRQKIIYYPLLPEKGTPGAERADYVRHWLEKFMYPSGMATEDESKANAYLVASGDGGMTEAARNKCDSEKLLFGINCGTLGFLMNHVRDIDVLPVYLDELNLVTVTLLEGTFYCRNGEIKTYLAFNDIFCGGNIADYVSFKIRGTLSHFRDRDVKGNGIFISTPQGTTGFALNARGSSSVLPLDTNTLYIGGVATGPYPNSVFNPQKATIDISSRRPVNGYADGYAQEALDIERIVVTPTDHHVTLGFLKNIDFESRRRELAHRVELGQAHDL